MELSDKKIWTYGLLCACPEGEPLPDCPLETYRTLPDKQKITILKNLSDEEVDKIIQYHNRCLLNRV